MRCLLDFMYNGEVNVKKSELSDLMIGAEYLCIKGLQKKEKEKMHLSKPNQISLVPKNLSDFCSVNDLSRSGVKEFSSTISNGNCYANQSNKGEKAQDLSSTSLNKSSINGVDKSEKLSREWLVNTFNECSKSSSAANGNEFVPSYEGSLLKTETINPFSNSIIVKKCLQNTTQSHPDSAQAFINALKRSNHFGGGSSISLVDDHRKGIEDFSQSKAAPEVEDIKMEVSTSLFSIFNGQPLQHYYVQT